MIEWSPFSPKALDFITNSTARLNIAHGSVRSSKTICCTVRWLEYMVSGPQGDLAMLGRTTATLQRNVLNDLFDIVGPGGYRWVNRQQGELNILGRRVYIFGANNEDAESKIRGATFAGALCDEVSLYPQIVFNQLMARMSVKGAMCFCNTNPDSPYHWFYTDYINNDEISDKKIWKFVMEDNLSLDEDYITSLKQMYKGVWYDRMILGNWVVAEGRIYDMFKPEVHMIDTEALLAQYIEEKQVHPTALKYYAACDYGTSTVMSWGLYVRVPLPGGRIQILKLREFYYDAVKKQEQHTDSEFVRMFAAWLGDQKIAYVYVDPSAASWKLELMRAGYTVLNANNDVLNGIRFVAAQISDGLFYMDRSCKNTEQEYNTYVWDATAQLQGKDKPLKTHDHTCDTDRYAIYTELGRGASGAYSVRR